MSVVTEEINVALTAALEDFISHAEAGELGVGFFEDAVYPDGTPVATVAEAHEFGVSKNNLPPRPFMRQAIDREQDKWTEMSAAGLAAVLDDKISYAAALNQLGLMVQADIKRSIIMITQPPWADSTREARERRKPKSIGKLLIDSGVMLASVDYRVEGLDDVGTG